MSVSPLHLALLWGFIWAACLQFTRWGRWLALRRTWFTVVVGIGVDLLIILLLIDIQTWLKIFAVVGFSSVGIIARSLYNELAEDAEAAHAAGPRRLDE
jgi:hypothetical protein